MEAINALVNISSTLKAVHGPFDLLRIISGNLIPDTEVERHFSHFTSSGLTLFFVLRFLLLVVDVLSLKHKIYSKFDILLFCMNMSHFGQSVCSIFGILKLILFIDIRSSLETFKSFGFLFCSA
jgi:hypothetical protein